MATLIVAAPQCTPARYWQTKVEGQLAEYGAKQAGLRVDAEKVGKSYIRITVKVSDDYANFAEYTLLRFGYQQMSRPINPKNQRWAQHHLDLAARGASWQEKGCSKKEPGAVIGELGVSAPVPSWRSQGKLWSQGYKPTTKRRKTRQHKGALRTWLEELLP
jgi:hypothetical protein